MPSRMARETAEAILDDLRGAAYYKDPAILAGFLRGRFGGTEKPETAADVAAMILDDFGGAAYYKDPAILAGFLEGQGIQ